MMECWNWTPFESLKDCFVASLLAKSFFKAYFRNDASNEDMVLRAQRSNLPASPLSLLPSILPSYRPTVLPSYHPTILPSYRPTVQPDFRLRTSSMCLQPITTRVHVNNDRNIHWNGILHLIFDDRLYDIELILVGVKYEFIMNLQDHFGF